MENNNGNGNALVNVKKLKKSVSDYFSALTEVFSKIEAFETETGVLIDKLQDHLRQVVSCQR